MKAESKAKGINMLLFVLISIINFSYLTQQLTYFMHYYIEKGCVLIIININILK